MGVDPYAISPSWIGDCTSGLLPYHVDNVDSIQCLEFSTPGPGHYMNPNLLPQQDVFMKAENLFKRTQLRESHLTLILLA